MTKSISPTHPFFREGTLIKETEINFVFNAGGLGDYIHWTPAIQWAIEKHPYLKGWVVTPPFFEDLARLWFKKYAPRYKVRVTKDIAKDKFLKGRVCSIPSGAASINASGFSMFDLGFFYYGNCDVQKGYDVLPQLPDAEPDKALPYAVITTHATSKLRQLSAKTINGIAKHLKARHVCPVFLGKTQIDRTYKSQFDEGIDWSLGSDLRDKTPLIHAATILSQATLVVGLDNGLLHLACCSRVPVIMAFTNVEPKYRVPPRQPGTVTLTIVPDETLKCRFCMTNMKFMTSRGAETCIYDDIACCKLMTAEPFIAAIDRILDV